MKLDCDLSTLAMQQALQYRYRSNDAKLVREHLKARPVVAMFSTTLLSD